MDRGRIGPAPVHRVKLPAIAIVLTLGFSSLAPAQEGVRLKSGRQVSGTFLIDEKDPDGFRVECWDTGAILDIRWSQIPESERDRLLHRLGDPETAPPSLIEGVLIVTSSRYVFGIMDREDSSLLYVKTNAGNAPTVIPKVAILRRDTVRIPEAEIYTPLERVDRRAAAAGKDYRRLLDAGRFAAGLQLPDRARDLYLRAIQADPSKKEEVEAVLVALEARVREAKAEDLMAEAKRLADEFDYARALGEARRIPREFPDTETAKRYGDLVAAIEKEQKEYLTHREELLVRKVGLLWPMKRSQLLSQAAGLMLVEARARIAKIDDEVVKDLCRRLKSDSGEILVAWEKREERKRLATYGSGTWIVRDGQDGGLDYTPPAQAPIAPPQPGGQILIPVGGGSRWWIMADDVAPSPKPLGQPLRTKDEWWVQSDPYDRKAWLEAEHASTSPYVKRVEQRSRKCGACLGFGLLQAMRSGRLVAVKCPRCHGVCEDVSVLFW